MAPQPQRGRRRLPALVAATPPPVRTRRRSAPSSRQYSVLVNVAGTIVDVTLIWSTRRRWEGRVEDGHPWTVLPIGSHFVIAIRVQP